MSDEPIVIVDANNQEPSIDHLMTDEVENRLIQFLKFLFSRSELYTYNDNELESKIHISDVFPVREVYESKPAVVINRQNMMMTNRGIGHFLGWTYSKNFGYKFTDMLQSQVVIECYSKSGLEAKKIANMVFMGILYYRRKLMEVGRVHDVLVANVGAETPQRVYGEVTLTAVPVQLSFTFAETWITEEIGEHLFEGVIVDIKGF